MKNEPSLKKLLPKNEIVKLLDLIHSTLHCREECDVGSIITELNSLIPFNFSVCALARINENGGIESYKTVNISYPDEWLQLYASNGYHAIDPVVIENFRNFKIQTWKETYRAHKLSLAFISGAEDFGLKAGYTHGVRAVTENKGSLFSFAGPSIEYHPRTSVILRYFIPHLHQALVRILAPKRSPLLNTLTMREKEILKWLKNGKSSWDISIICGISLRTVNFHTDNIKKKLNASNRCHAIAIALEHELIDID